MSIKQWPINERPRERLLQQSVEVLSDAELLAIIFREGHRSWSALDISRELLIRFESLRGIFNVDLTTFCSQRGLGPAKYCQLQATKELGRRYLRESLQQRHAIRSSKDAQDFIIASLRDYPHEVFAALFLDNQHRVIQFEHLFYGTINAASVYPREVAKRALHHNAAAMIVAHNHPSGLAEPSRTDIEMTQWLKKALELIEVELLDHLVVGDQMAISMADRGVF